MTRKAPRQSSLSNRSPIQPAVEAPKVEREESTVVPPSSQATRPQAAADTVAPKKKSKYPPKVSFYQDPEDTERLRAAILHTIITEGNRNLSQFIDKAVMKEVERLEKKYNGGKPFPPVPGGGMPRGAAAASREP